MSASSFIFDGGRACLDFVNTLRKRKDPLTDSVDALQEHGMRGWLATARKQASWAAGIPEWSNQVSSVDLPPSDSPQILREAIYGLLTDEVSALRPTTRSHHDGMSRGDRILTNIEKVNSYASEAISYKLKELPEGRLEIDNLLTERKLLGFIANDAIRLLGGDGLSRVKECAHDRCGILFEDHSNGLKRQWCSMRRCGNSSKAERFSKR